uniref:Uncharacterized protein n=1 Tax=Hyaloperonospora arabidopsidis (strain Emoy2) TaxID=559515 RepID=M4BRI7_HYAAE
MPAIDRSSQHGCKWSRNRLTIIREITGSKTEEHVREDWRQVVIIQIVFITLSFDIAQIADDIDDCERNLQSDIGLSSLIEPPEQLGRPGPLVGEDAIQAVIADVETSQ